MKQQILSFLPGDHPWQNQIIWYDVTDSTNTQAKTLALDGAPHGTVVIADHQTGGRGRLGRSFQSPGGMGVYMSVILHPQCKPEQLMHLTCAAAVAACDAVDKAAGFRPSIKWTNDLVFGKRKLAGILTELVTAKEQTAAIIGIGINCCQTQSDFDPEIQSFAGSLSMVTGAPIDRAKVAAALMEAISYMADSLLSGKQAMMDAYRRSCITVGQDVRLLRSDAVFYGHAQGIDDDGALIVRFADGHTEAVNSGEVSVRGMYGYN